MHVPQTRALQKLPEKQRAALSEVADFSLRHLCDIRRRTGETYADHCAEVAAVLGEVTDDSSILRVALLHDLALHPDAKSLLSVAPLSDPERELVTKMSELRRLHIDAETRDLDTVLQAFASDHRLLPLRMAHRLNDIRHMDRFEPRILKAIAHETLHMYAAIAGRLSMHTWRHEMEDACFRYLQPVPATALEKQFKMHEKNDQQCLEHVRALLLKELENHGIKADISCRTKTLYSSYTKMVVKERQFLELTDRLAVRIIVEDLDACYRTLGIVHACLHPIPGKLKDYIGAPKENGYRSIHTIVYPLPGVSEYPVEIQIRSVDMHRECEYGSARHSDYKHCLYGFQSRLARVDLFSNLAILRESARNPEQFGKLLRTYFRDKQIALFDPQDNLYHLPSPVSALDFACHTAGRHVRYLKDIRVNGRAAPLDARLNDGDTVECRFTTKPTMRTHWSSACLQNSSKKLLASIQKDTHAA